MSRDSEAVASGHACLSNAPTVCLLLLLFFIIFYFFIEFTEFHRPVQQAEHTASTISVCQKQKGIGNYNPLMSLRGAKVTRLLKVPHLPSDVK